MLSPSGTAPPDRILIQGSLFIQGCTFCKHAHLMFSERGHDGIERDTEQWFKSPQREGPGKGRDAEIAGVQGRGLAGEDP